MFMYLAMESQMFITSSLVHMTLPIAFLMDFASYPSAISKQKGTPAHL